MRLRESFHEERKKDHEEIFKLGLDLWTEIPVHNPFLRNDSVKKAKNEKISKKLQKMLAFYKNTSYNNKRCDNAMM